MMRLLEARAALPDASAPEGEEPPKEPDDRKRG